MVIFTVLILVIFEHGRSFHLLVSSSISFFNILTFLLNSVSVPWEVLFQDSFGDTIHMSGTSSLISFLVYLPFVCKKAVDFCMLILYLATLLNDFSQLWVEVSGSIMCRIISSAHKDTLTSFAICIPFIFLTVLLH